MPGDVIAGLIGFIKTFPDLAANGGPPDPWDGEVPRTNESQAVINLDNGPVFRIVMDESGLDRTYTMANAYKDDGPMTLEVWATTRALAQLWVGQLESALLYDINWPMINLQVPNFQVYDLRLLRWWVGMEETFRSTAGNYIYRGDLHLHVGYNGAVLSGNGG